MLLQESLVPGNASNPDPRSQNPGEENEADKGKTKALDILAIYYVRKGKETKDPDKKKDYFAKATALFIQADKLVLYEQYHLLGRAYYCLTEGKIDQADAQFNFVLTQQVDSDNIPSLLGRACIEFNKKELEGKRIALQLYKKALSLNPRCPADVRLGIGHCFYRLNNIVKAEQAFNRALAIDSRCVGALVGLAIIELNKKTVESMKKGVKMLERAYKIDPNDPMVLIHLANHFFFRKKDREVMHLARKALENTEVEAMQAESCYQMARAYHLNGQYDEAFEFYYKATQFSSPQFILPQYGLGQMYIHRGECELATQCFENVLKVNPNDYESMKVLGSLYAATSSQTKREQALNYFKKVTEQNPKDHTAWIELASISEQKDTQLALTAYKTAIQILEETEEGPVPPEIYNNIAALLFSSKNLTEAEIYYNLALKQCEEGMMKDEQYYSCIIYTIRYNLGRLYESLYQHNEAEKVYKDILKKHPNYIDCYLRLGCMDRDRGQIFDASDRFKEALRVDPDHADAWSLIGNLHLAKQEWGPGQKKFERILENNQKSKQNPDIYSLIAMGNVWLQNLYQPIKDKEKLKRQRERALQFYKSALKHDPRNIWAASGIGCVLANKGLLNEARDVFAQVREATADFPDVWVNIAHIYVEQKQYVAAVQMYENCLKKFYSHPNTEIMLYISRAYFKANKLDECKNTLLQARHVCPHDTVILYNLAVVLKKLASQRFRDTKSSLRTVLMSVDELGLAHKYFHYLCTCGDKSKLDTSAAAREVRECQDLLSQATIFVTRARKLDDDERERRRLHEEQLAISKASKEEEERLKEEEERRRKEEMEAKRKEIIRKQEETKHKIAEEPSDERPSKKRKIQRTENTDGFITDASNSADEKLANEERLERQKKKAKKRRVSEDKKSRKSKSQRKSKGETSSNKRSSSSKFKSKEIVSSSDNDSDSADSDDEERPTKSLVIAESSKSKLDDSDSEVERSSDDQKEFHGKDDDSDSDSDSDSEDDDSKSVKDDDDDNKSDKDDDDNSKSVKDDDDDSKSVKDDDDDDDSKNSKDDDDNDAIPRMKNIDDDDDEDDDDNGKNDDSDSIE